jgi:hypothetical protein
MQKRDILNSPRLQELKRRRQKNLLKKFYIFVFLFVLLLVGLAFLFRIDRLNIQDVKVSGNVVIDTALIKNTANETLAGNYLWVFPKTNLFLYSKKSITTSIAGKFKRLKNISVDTDQAGTLLVSVEERTPKYTWCGETMSVESGAVEACYFLDDTGFIFDYAPEFKGDVYFKFFGTTSNSNTIGSSVIATYFKDFILFKENIETLGLRPVSFYKLGDGDAKVYLASESGLSGPEIIFKEGADFQKLTENLQSALEVEPLHTDIKKKYISLLYIDLRFGNKVYYKFRP